MENNTELISQCEARAKEWLTPSFDEATRKEVQKMLDSEDKSALIDAFYQKYSRIFDCGTYNNMKTGVFDLYGINYYSPALIDPISEKLSEEKPEEYEALAAWLSQAKAHNGFYILGI